LGGGNLDLGLPWHVRQMLVESTYAMRRTVVGGGIRSFGIIIDVEGYQKCCPQLRELCR
jgi:hypothetical protein